MATNNTFTGNTAMTGTLTVGGVPITGGGGVTCTTAESHYYAAGTTGNDANPGTVGSPKLTPAGVNAIVPDYIKHNTVVHLSETFTDWGSVDFTRHVAPGILYIIDGGTDKTDIVADTISDINSASTIGLTTAGWTIDNYKGYQVKITSGARNGDIRTIHGNTATTITVTKNFGADPGAGAHFEIIRPTTTLTASATDSYFNIGNTGKGTTIAQNMYFSGDQCSLFIMNSPGTVCVSGIVLGCTNASYANAVIRVKGCADVQFIWGSVYTTTPTAIALNTLNYSGVGMRGAGLPVAEYPVCLVQECLHFITTASYYMHLTINRTNYAEIYNGVRTHWLTLYSVQRSEIYSAIGYALASFDNAPGGNSGINTRHNTYLKTGDYVTCPNNSDSGILAVGGAIVYISGTTANLAGTGNASYGLAAVYNTTILVTSGGTPTIAGASGEAYTLGGATTWANINAGTINLDANSQSLIRRGDS